MVCFERSKGFEENIHLQGRSTCVVPTAEFGKLPVV